MIARWAAPLLLVVAVMLGGSVQNPVNLLAVEWLAIAMLAWAYLRPAGSLAPWARQLLVLAWIAGLLVALQIVPLPPFIWHALPGRQVVVEGDSLMGLTGVWRPLSLQPEATLGTLMAMSVPLAILAVSLRRAKEGASSLAMALVVAAAISALWGLAQIMGQAPHPYAFSSVGPTGPFANTNHLATLLIAAIPVSAALALDMEKRTGSGAWKAIAGLLAVLMAIVTMLTGSYAAIGLLVVVGPLSALILFPNLVAGPRRASFYRLAAGILVVVIAAVLMTPWLPGDATTSASSRSEIWHQSLALAPFMVAGGGFGSFGALYALTDNPFLVSYFFVNHAHNDLLELAIEGGIPALILVVLFVIWLAKAAARSWRPGLDSRPYARAGTVAAVAILAHSLVDFPLRTLADMACLAGALAMIALGRPAIPVERARDLRPTRHRQVR